MWRHGDWIEFTERGSAIITGAEPAAVPSRDGLADPEAFDRFAAHTVAL